MNLADRQLYEKQSLGLSSIDNARQMGGYVMKDGRMVRQGLLFRSGKLMNASDEDLRILSDKYGIANVYDLRTAFEIDHMPDRSVPGAFYLNMPIEDADNNMWVDMMQMPGETMQDKLLAFCRTQRAKEMTKHIYVGFVSDEYCQLQFAAFLDKLIYVEGPVLWHCTQGKDRTGLAAAFLLAALGADRETIVRDFALTNVPYQPIVDTLEARLRSTGGDDRDLSVIQTLEGVNVQYFLDAMDYIDTIYGSMEAYLKKILVLTDAEIEKLRDKYLCLP